MAIDRSSTKEYNEERGAVWNNLDINSRAFSSYCLSLFSVVNQFGVVNILSEYTNPTQRRIDKVPNFEG